MDRAKELTAVGVFVWLVGVGLLGDQQWTAPDPQRNALVLIGYTAWVVGAVLAVVGLVALVAGAVRRR